MKTLMISLLFILMGSTAFSQATFFTTGITHTIQSSNAAAALGDSIHTIGIVDMRQQAGVRVDSFQIQCSTSDSLNIRYFVVPLQTPLATSTIADSTAGCGFVTNVATGGYQFTADGIALVSWQNIAAAITQTRTGARFYRIYARVYAVGSELRGTTKTFKTTIAAYD